jgi:hypothetical protein
LPTKFGSYVVRDTTIKFNFLINFRSQFWIRRNQIELCREVKSRSSFFELRASFIIFTALPGIVCECSGADKNRIRWRQTDVKDFPREPQKTKKNPPEEERHRLADNMRGRLPE